MTFSPFLSVVFGSIRLGLGLLGCAQERLAPKGKGMPMERCSHDKLTQPGQANVTRVTEQGKGENMISWSWMQGHTPSAVSTVGLQPGKIRTSSPEL